MNKYNIYIEAYLNELQKNNFIGNAIRGAIRPRNIGRPPMYHGSQVKGLTTLEPRPSHVLEGELAVFGTPDRDVALSFSAPWRDDDIQLGSVNGQLYMREQYLGAFVKIFKGKSGIVYSLDGEFSEDPRLTRFERIARVPTKVTNAEEIPDILEALQQTKFLMLRHGEIAPWEE